MTADRRTGDERRKKKLDPTIAATALRDTADEMESWNVIIGAQALVIQRLRNIADGLDSAPPTTTTQE